MESSQRTHSQYPHLDEDEWKMVVKLSSVIGETATLQILALSEKEQKKALQKAMVSSTIRDPTPPVPAVSIPKVKIETSIYKALEHENLPQWFTEIELSLVAQQLSDPTLQVVYAMSRLGGRARSWAFSRKMTDPNCFPTWKNFKAELSTAFEPPKCELRSRVQFLQLTQGKRSLHEYAQNARQLVARVVSQPIDDATQVSVFLNGLRDGPVRDHSFRVFPETLDKAINIALQEEFSLKQSRRIKNFGISNPNQGKRNTNVPTPMDLSFAQVVRKNIPNRNNNMTNIICHRCGKKGHIARNCYVKIPNDKRNNKNFRRRPLGSKGQKPKSSNDDAQ